MNANQASAGVPRLRYSLLLSALATALTPVYAAEPAQPAEGEKAERIEVTGSRIKRSDAEIATPVTVLTAEDLAVSGQPTIEDFLQSMPFVTGHSFGASINNGNNGFATAALRGVGSSRTLLLVNGRRFVSGDLNAIPTSAVERIEVLKNGASAVYGSDAIAGVINVILKKNFDGVSIQAQYDVTGEGDGEVQKYAMTIGSSSEKGHALVTLDYTLRDTIWQKDRDYSKCPLGESGGKRVCLGSGTTSPGQVVAPAGAWGAAGSYVISGGAPVPFSGPAHGFNYAAASYMVTPQEVFSMNSFAEYEMSDSVSAFLETGMANRQSDQLLAAEGTFWGVVVPGTAPGNVFGKDVTVFRRLTETGGRNYTQDTSDWRIVTGLEGTLSNDWDWGVSYQKARFVDSAMITGQANRARYDILVDPAKCQATAGCPGYWNPMLAGTLTPAMIQWASVTNTPLQKQELSVLSANLSGEIASLELPGGAPQWYVGIEQRKESLLSQPDGAASLGQIYFVSGSPTKGEFEVNEQFFEANLPVLDGVNISLAGRRSDYDYLKKAESTGKVGIDWRPMDGLMLRYTWTEGFRAPTIGNLFNPQAQSAPSYTDPCINWGASTNANLRANCAADGLAQNFPRPTAGQASAVVGGNPNLAPETAETHTAGVVWSPTADFSLVADWFKIEIEDGIGSFGTDTIVGGCYASANFSSPLCQYITGPKNPIINDAPLASAPTRRNAITAVSGVMLLPYNLATFGVEGIDFDATYRLNMAGGRLTLNLAGAYLLEHNYKPFSDAKLVDKVGKHGDDVTAGATPVKAAFPELRLNASAGYTYGDWSANWALRYIGESTDVAPASSKAVVDIDPYIYHDISGSYSFGAYSVQAGVRNLMDKAPPYVTAYQDMNTINVTYDTAGRYFFVRLNANF